MREGKGELTLVKTLRVERLYACPPIPPWNPFLPTYPPLPLSSPPDQSIPSSHNLKTSPDVASSSPLPPSSPPNPPIVLGSKATLVAGNGRLMEASCWYSFRGGEFECDGPAEGMRSTTDSLLLGPVIIDVRAARWLCCSEFEKPRPYSGTAWVSYVMTRR